MNWRLFFCLGSSLVVASTFGVLLRTEAEAVEKVSDWPRFRGPDGMGASAAKDVPLSWGPDENIVWKTVVPAAGASSPVLFGPHIFLAGYSGFGIPGKAGAMEQLQRHLICLDRAGKLLWTKNIASKLPEQARIREEHGYASSTPVVDAERVYVFFGASGMFAFDHAGNQLWQADCGSALNGWGSAASPILHGDLVIVNASVESTALIALDKKTGKEVWRAGNIREAWNTPLVVKAPDGRAELIVPVMGKVLAFDPDSGTPLWTCNTDIPWYMVPSVVAHEGVVFAFGGRPGGSLAVRSGGKGDVTRTQRLWTSPKGTNVPSPLYHERYLYWMHDALGIAYCAEAQTGRLIYEERVAGNPSVYASPILADGRIYYLARDGRTFVLAARPKYELLATNSLGERAVFNSSPAVADGRLYIRSNQYLYCIGTK